MTEAASLTPDPEPASQSRSRVRSVAESISRGGFEVLAFTFIGPFALATLQAAIALLVFGAQWLLAGTPPLETPARGEPLWFGFVAIYWAVYLYLPPPFFFTGAVYTVVSRLLAPTLSIALLSGLIGFPAFWLLAGWSVPTTGGSYFSAINAMFAAEIALAVAFCWWVVKQRPRRAAQQAV